MRKIYAACKWRWLILNGSRARFCIDRARNFRYVRWNAFGRTSARFIWYSTTRATDGIALTQLANVQRLTADASDLRSYISLHLEFQAVIRAFPRISIAWLSPIRNLRADQLMRVQFDKTNVLSNVFFISVMRPSEFPASRAKLRGHSRRNSVCNEQFVSRDLRKILDIHARYFNFWNFNFKLNSKELIW